jgi:hypothetical protein
MRTAQAAGPAFAGLKVKESTEITTTLSVTQRRMSKQP